MSAYRDAGGAPLGALVQDIRPPRGYRIALYAVIALGALIDLGALLSRPKGDGWLVVAFAGILLPFFAILALISAKVRRLRIFEDGVIVGEETAFRWDDVVELVTTRVMAGRTRAVMDLHKVRLANGTTVDIVDRSGALLAHVRRGTGALVAATREKLSRGPLTFGDITLDEAGVRTDVTLIPWKSVENAYFDGPLDSVVVHGGRGAWIEFPLHDIPNAHVMIALIKERIAT